MLYESYPVRIERLPDLDYRPHFDEPWRFARDAPAPYFWRIDSDGMIYRVDATTGDIRRL